MRFIVLSGRSEKIIIQIKLLFKIIILQNYPFEQDVCRDSRAKLVEINMSFLGLADLTQIQVLRNQLHGCSFTSD